jgi:hypothetical protein
MHQILSCQSVGDLPLHCVCVRRSLDPHSGQIAQRKRAFVDIESTLQEQLDPIDWATYEPHLWGNEARFCQRASTLFGSLMHLRKVQPEVRRSTQKLESIGLVITAGCTAQGCSLLRVPVMHNHAGRQSLQSHWIPLLLGYIPRCGHRNCVT